MSRNQMIDQGRDRGPRERGDTEGTAKRDQLGIAG